MLILYFITLFIFWFKSFDKILKAINYINYFLRKTEVVKNENEKISRIKNNKKRLKPIENKNINNIKSENEIKNGIFSEQILQSADLQIIKIENENTFGLEGLNDIYIKEILAQKDFEIFSLNYEEAILLGNKNLLQYYIYLLKYDHPIMLSFAPYVDYNSRILKIFLFFFLFGLNLNINVLFFNNDIIDKIYEDNGKYNFSYQIPQILYSALISKFIDSLIKYLALSQDDIVDLKREKMKKDFDKGFVLKLIRNLKIKFISFFIITFIVIVFFLYYITCFCGVYSNTQKHFIIDSVISFIITLILPFVTYLIPGLFRFLALRGKNFTRALLYKFSSFLWKLLR